MQIRQIEYNVTPKKRSRKDIKYIVVHDTGNTDVGADAWRHFTYFNSGDRKSSADFFVDDHVILKVNDYYSGYTWHCGDGKGKYDITNANSVGTELCVNADANSERALANMAELVHALMQELDIDIDHVVRHYDASRKNCPQSMNNGTWKKWIEFRERLKDKMNKLEELENRIVKLEQRMVYNYIDDNMPSWARSTMQKLVDKKILQGDEFGNLGLTEEMLRILVMLDRNNVFEKK